MAILLIFIVVPLLELWLLFEVAGHIGGLTTLAVVIITACVGVAMLKHQSVSTLTRAQDKWELGGLAVTELAEAVLFAFGGVLLLTPGFVTDILGLALLIAPLRRALAARFAHQGMQVFLSRVSTGNSGFSVSSRAVWRSGRSGNLFEGEVTSREYAANDDVGRRTKTIIIEPHANPLSECTEVSDKPRPDTSDPS